MRNNSLNLSRPIHAAIIAVELTFVTKKEMDMLHVVHIQNDEQYMAATEILDFIKGTWHARGPATAPVLFLPDEHYNVLVKAGVIPANGKKGEANGKKTRPKKTKS
jgi:hypothetical protein